MRERAEPSERRSSPSLASTTRLRRSAGRAVHHQSLIRPPRATPTPPQRFSAPSTPALDLITPSSANSTHTNMDTSLNGVDAIAEPIDWHKAEAAACDAENELLRCEILQVRSSPSPSPPPSPLAPLTPLRLRQVEDQLERLPQGPEETSDALKVRSNSRLSPLGARPADPSHARSASQPSSSSSQPSRRLFTSYARVRPPFTPICCSPWIHADLGLSRSRSPARSAHVRAPHERAGAPRGRQHD